MRDEIREALESCTSVGLGSQMFGNPIPRHKYQNVKFIVKHFLQEIPEGMTVQEILEELQENENSL